MVGLLSDLARAVENIAVEPPKPDWAVANIPGAEEAITVSQRDASSAWAGFMRYADTNGVLSERRIVCRSIEGYGAAETISAYCCERKASRRFRIDRIQELVCLETGEVIDPVPHFELMRLHGALKVVDKSLSDLGRILVFMARCDGSVHPLEAAAVEEGMARYVLRFGGDDRVLETALKNVGKIAPDGEDLVAALSRISRHPEAQSVARLVLDCMGKVSMADGKLHPDELEWTDIATQYLSNI